MKIAISNIAWTHEEDPAAYALLRACGIDFLEIAPPRWWPDPLETTPQQIAASSATAHAAGFTLIAFQAILFGRPDLTLFGPAEKRCEAVIYLRRMAEIAAACGVQPMVFGGPKNRRIPDRFSRQEAETIGIEFFAEIATHAARLGVYFCLEPNPTAYECNYLTHVDETARIVRMVNSPGLRLQLDAGALALNEEDIVRAVHGHIDVIGHVHCSQPMLGDFAEPWPGHRILARCLAGAGYDRFVSVEMKRPANGLEGVRVALEFALDCYGSA